MEITCDIAMDLVDIYSSSMASSDTVKAVREHLRTCRSCRDFYSEYKANLAEEKKKEEKNNRTFRTESSPYVSEEIISESVKRLSKKLRTRRIVSNVVSIFSVIVGFIVLAKDIFDLIDEKDK